MNTDSDTKITIAFSGSMSIARRDLESLLRGVMTQSDDAERRDTQPNIENAQPKPDFGPPQRLAFSMQETADILGVSYATVWRLLQRGLLKSSNALG